MKKEFKNCFHFLRKSVINISYNAKRVQIIYITKNQSTQKVLSISNNVIR